MTESLKAVFLSYASQDAEAARRICEALRAAGVEVWFDQSELRGGDAWDHNIRQQIHDCALFVPIISAHTDERTEGYFRLEWKLAVDRSHLMSDDAAFLFPIVIDDTPDATARVPDKFRAVQWTRLPAGETPAAFPQRVSALLAGTARPARAAAGTIPGATTPWRRPGWWLAFAAVAALLAGVIGLLSWRAITRAPGGAAVTTHASAPAASTAPAHSIAVLPFADMSAAKDQEYFSDGLAEELLNLLSKVPGLQVAARTSAFSFKGHASDIPTIGKQLMVANVLEGSVRKVGNHLRVTTQLVRAENGYEVWSGTYDRELGDIFHLQDEIAAAVVKALKVTLLGNSAPRSTSTQNPDAYLVFLQGRAKMATQRIADAKAAAADFTRVIKLDPSYGPAYVELAGAKMFVAEYEVTSNRQAEFRATIEECKVLIEQALALDPTNAQAFIERGHLRAAFSDLKGAEQDYRRGIELNPNSARGYDGLVEVLQEDPDRSDEILPLLERAGRLDPLDPTYDLLRAVFLFLRRGDTRTAEAILTDVIAKHPLNSGGLWRLAEVIRMQARPAEAILYGEQALKLDPLYQWGRRLLSRYYCMVGDIDAARQVVDQTAHPLPIQQLDLLARAGNWRRAAAVTYAALDDGSILEIDYGTGFLAMRIDARQSHEFRRARRILEQLGGITWSAAGIPILARQAGQGVARVALGDILIQSGERQRGERLLRASLTDMDRNAKDLKRGDLWYVGDQAMAYAMLGDRRSALALLRRVLSVDIGSAWQLLMVEPAFDAWRGDPEFQAIVAAYKEKVAVQRRELDRMRADGRVPQRSNAGSRPPMPPPAEP